MPGSLLHRTWEVSSVPGADRVGRGRQSRHPAIDADEKSDTSVVPKKQPNKWDNPAEAVEGRGVAEGNAGEAPTHRTQSRDRVSMGLEGVREAARRDRRAPKISTVGETGSPLPDGSLRVMTRGRSRMR